MAMPLRGASEGALPVKTKLETPKVYKKITDLIRVHATKTCCMVDCGKDGKYPAKHGGVYLVCEDHKLYGYTNV